MFQKDRKSFFRTLEKVEKHEGEMSEMETFVEFWGGIWEQNEPTPNMPRMEEVKAELNEKANIVSEIGITEEKLRKKNIKTKELDSPRSRWYSKFLVEEVYTSTEGTSKGIYHVARRHSDDTGVVAIWKNCPVAENEKLG